MNRYAEVKNEIQERWNAFPIGFAFSNEQFEEEKKRLGVESEDELLGIGFGGGFIRKSDKDAFHELIDWSAQRRLDELAKDKDGSGYMGLVQCEEQLQPSTKVGCLPRRKG